MASGLPPVDQQKAIIGQAAQRYGVSPAILWGLYGTETSFGHNVSTSSAGAVGPFQFEPSTAKGMGVNPYDFTSAAQGAAKYLSQYKSRGLGGMLSAYNAGPAGALQPGYVASVEQNAKSWTGAPGGVTPAATTSRVPGVPKAPVAASAAPAASQVDNTKLLALQSSDQASTNLNRALGMSAPSFPTLPAATTNAPTVGQATPLPKPLGVPSQTAPSAPSAPASSGTGGTGGNLAGFLPPGAPLTIKRIDQGQDIATKPGGPITAPGDGTVIAVNQNPGGFGNSYPVVKFTSGPLAGQSVYIGHTHSTLKVGDHFKAGDVLSHTGYGTAAEGNARVPGWAEIGLWGPGGPLGHGSSGATPAGQQISKTLLRKR